MFAEHECPFYEEFAGEYYQGCWEHYDICWCSQELGTSPNCYNGCFLIQNDEKRMLETCLKALNEPVEVMYFSKPSLYRPRTQSEKDNIIKSMETFMKVFNKRFNPTSLYV